MTVDPEVLVLLSGGVDSAACVALYLELGRPPCGLFVDYGQLAREEEARAADAVARHYGIALRAVEWRGHVRKTAGLIPGRNLFLIAAAAMERAQRVQVIALGLHAGTSYADCSPEFLRSAADVVQCSGGRDFTLSAPFIDWPKADVYSYAERQGVPFALTYSCERPNGPCGECLSCSDRRILDARA